MDGKPEKGAAAGRTNDDRAENPISPDDPTEPTPAPSAEIAADDDVRELDQEEISALITPVVGDESEFAGVQASGLEDLATSDSADRKTIPPDAGPPATPEETEESIDSMPVSGADPPGPPQASVQVPPPPDPDTDTDHEASIREDKENKTDVTADLADGEVAGSISPGQGSHSGALKTLGKALAVSLVLVAVCGYVLLRNYSLGSPLPIGESSSGSLAPVTKHPVSKRIDPVPNEEVQDRQTIDTGPAPEYSLRSRPTKLQTRLTEIRQAMQIKMKELNELQEQYRIGIRRIEEEIAVKIRLGNIRALTQAMEQEGIELQLQAIQRRLSYIQQLEKPIQWLNQSSEELLYLQRKHEIESMVMPVCRSITMDRMTAECDDAVRRYEPATLQAQMKVDLKEAAYPSFDRIWTDILQLTDKNGQTDRTHGHLSPPGNQPGPVSEPSVTNQALYKEICSGRFDRKYLLTALSDEAASCLASWSETDLFLNRIDTLPPGAARNLTKWKGKWLGLNGLIDLSPEAASHLFGWKGDWVSLNGLRYLSSDSSAYLAKWSGKRLEMMGLSPALMFRDLLALKHLAAWEKKGNKLFVSEDIRMLIASEG